MDTTPKSTHRLPVPNIIEEKLEYTLKQDNVRHHAKKPPSIKLSRRNMDSFFNRSSGNLSALSISFRGGYLNVVSSEITSTVYDKTSDESYFSQCFEKISILGEGSFGEVLKVRSIEDGLLYAVKRTKQFFRGEKNRHQCLEEVRRYEQFSHHENCVKLIQAWEESDRLYMQMELCQESLEQYARRVKSVEEKRIWEIMLDLLLALKCLHDKNLMHLDIKLDNILIGDGNICKLADFGLVLDTEDTSVATEGDSRYMAPELLQGIFNKAADIYSLGMVALELSSDIELPLHGPLWQQLRSDILPIFLIQDRSTELQATIKVMMSADYLRRPTVNDLLRHQKISELLAQRRRWYICKEIKKTVRKAKRSLWITLNRLKTMFKNFFTVLLIKLRLKKEKAFVFPKTETSSLDSLNESNIEGSPAGRFAISSQIVNSTPVQCRSRSRQYLRARHEARENGNDDSDLLDDFDRSNADSDDSFLPIRGKINF